MSPLTRTINRFTTSYARSISRNSGPKTQEIQTGKATGRTRKSPRKIPQLKDIGDGDVLSER